MYSQDLIKTFESIVKESHPKLVVPEFIDNLSTAIANKKYDVQDQALIETMLEDDRQTITESFSEVLNLRLKKETDVSNFIKSEEGQKEIIDLFLKSIEHTIDFYYNSIISKQFSST